MGKPDRRWIEKTLAMPDIPLARALQILLWIKGDQRFAHIDRKACTTDIIVAAAIALKEENRLHQEIVPLLIPASAVNRLVNELHNFLGKNGVAPLSKAVLTSFFETPIFRSAKRTYREECAVLFAYLARQAKSQELCSTNKSVSVQDDELRRMCKLIETVTIEERFGLEDLGRAS